MKTVARPESANTGASLALERRQPEPAHQPPMLGVPPPVTTGVEEEPPDVARRAILDVLRAAVLETAAQELAGTGWTAEQCPYIEYWFAYYERRSASEIEAALHRYVPATAAATSSAEYIAPVAARVRDAIRRWRATAEVDAPEVDVPQAAATAANLGAGEALDSTTRTRFEAAMGVDLSSTRIHRDARAAGIAANAGARAFAIGDHVAFGANEYRPGTLTGDAMLAHELAHTRQQVAARGDEAAQEDRADESVADRAAVGVILALGGARPSRPNIPARRGLALRRCKGGYHPDFKYRAGELKQTTWLRTFREDHPELENIGLVGGVRDDGILTETGVRVPKVLGHLLKPRPHYERWEAAFVAYQGYVHYAELFEAGHDSAATTIGESLLSRTGRSMPNDNELDLDAYTHWSRKAVTSREGAQVGLMVADIYMAGVSIAENLATPRVPPSAPAPPPAPNVEPQPPPKVVVDEPAAPSTAPPKAESKPAPVTSDEPPAQATTLDPKRGYRGEWPPPEPGPRPAKTAAADDMAAWRYKRYVRDSYNAGKSPDEILTPEGYQPYAKAADTPGARPGRGGGAAQKATRAGPAQAEGFQNTETTQLGSRTDPGTGETEANMVDGYRQNESGGTDYLEVDDINKNGLPRAGMRPKIKSEIEALKPNDSLEYWDKNDPSRRIRYQYGDSPDVVDTRAAPTVPRKPRTPKS